MTEVEPSISSCTASGFLTLGRLTQLLICISEFIK